MPDPHALPPALDDQPLGEDFDRLGWFAQARRIAALRDGCDHGLRAYWHDRLGTHLAEHLEEIDAMVGGSE